MSQTPPPVTEPPGLVDAHGLLKAVWPDENSRPSLRWLRELQARRALPFIRIGRRIFFEPDRVRAALRKFEVKPVAFA